MTVLGRQSQPHSSLPKTASDNSFNEDDDMVAELVEDLKKEPKIFDGSSVAGQYRRVGSIALKDQSADAIRELANIGFTGETYYDFDRTLGVADPICILHFNDVYHIEPAPDGTGGVSRFISAMRQFQNRNPLVLFSGDVFNPSMMSTSTKGRHMVPFLNMLKVHTACVGNHDFDFGVDQMEYLMGSCQCQWVCSNVFDADSPDRPIGGASLYRLFEWQGHRVGIIGLVEYEWITTLAMVEECDIVYKDFVEQADHLCEVLRNKECDLIIALTHMRAPNDEKLAREAADIDLILGGHDHDYYGLRRLGRTIVGKSGSDFREFSCIEIHPSLKVETKDQKPESYWYDIPLGTFLPHYRDGGILPMPRFCGGSSLEWQCVSVTPNVVPNNRHVDALVSRYVADMESQMDKVLGEISCDIETRFCIIRNKETNSGNWLCDLMREYCRADIAVLNSGTVRSDRVLPRGEFKMRDLVNMLPMQDALTVIKLKGTLVLKMLENSVSQFPRLEGRFLQVSGVKFQFDPEQVAGSRVVVGTVKIDDKGKWKELDVDADYSVCTKEYLVTGRDGFGMLVGAEVLLDHEACPTLPTMLRNSFSFQAMANGYRKPHNQATMRRLETLKEGAVVGVSASQCMRKSDDSSAKFLVFAQVEGRIINIRESSC